MTVQKRQHNMCGGASSSALGPKGEPVWATMHTTPPPVPYWFETTKDGVVGGTVDIGAKAVCTIGRSSSCDVVLEHPSVSRQHAVLLHTCQGHVLFDLGSIHGTSLALPIPDTFDGLAASHSDSPSTERGTVAAEDICTGGCLKHIRRRLPKHEQVPLREGQCIVFGASRKVFTLRCASSARGRAAVGTLAEEGAASAPPCTLRWELDSRVTPLALPPRKTMGVVSPMVCRSSAPDGGDLTRNASGAGEDTSLPGLSVPVKRKRSVTFSFASEECSSEPC